MHKIKGSSPRTDWESCLRKFLEPRAVEYPSFHCQRSAHRGKGPSLCSPGSADKSGARKSPRNNFWKSIRDARGQNPRRREQDESQKEISSEKLLCRRRWAHAQKIRTSKSSLKGNFEYVCLYNILELKIGFSTQLCRITS